MTVVYLYGFGCLAETKAMSSAKKFLDKAQLDIHSNSKVLGVVMCIG